MSTLGNDYTIQLRNRGEDLRYSEGVRWVDCEITYANDVWTLHADTVINWTVQGLANTPLTESERDEIIARIVAHFRETGDELRVG